MANYGQNQQSAKVEEKHLQSTQLKKSGAQSPKEFVLIVAVGCFALLGARKLVTE